MQLKEIYFLLIFMELNKNHGTFDTLCILLTVFKIN